MNQRIFELARRIPRGIETKAAAGAEADLLQEIAAIKSEILAKVNGGSDAMKAMQKQLDELDLKLAEHHSAGGFREQKTLVDLMKNSDQFQRLLTDKRGKAHLVLTGDDARLFERKTTMTSSAVGSSTSGVLQIQRLDGITSESRQGLSVRDLLTSSPTTFQVVDYVKVSVPLSIASPAPEASLKGENQLNFTSLSERVRTIAHWLPCTRQLLDDMVGLVNFIQTSMLYYLNLAEEIQLLSGDGTGENLHGLIPQSTAFNPALLKGSWNKIDIIGRAVQQITAAKELQPTFVVMHPNDWWDVRLTKDGFGHYVLGDPQQGGTFTANGFVLNPTQNLFGLAVVPTTNIAVGSFLIGSGNPAATQIQDRMESIVEISTEHQDFFTKNLIAIRAEKRLCLITRRPGSFVTGSFTTSP